MTFCESLTITFIDKFFFAAFLLAAGFAFNYMIERLKSTFTRENDSLKHELQLIAQEHQVKLSKLHERRAEVVADLYALLVETQRTSQSFVSVTEFTGEASKRDKFKIAYQKSHELLQYLDKNLIYLPETLCLQLEEFIGGMRTNIILFGLQVSKEDSQFHDDEKIKAWWQAYEYFEKKIPLARKALESELRTLLGQS